ncbi:hypothetical protein [Pandoravirus japonicus]|uniref:Uncharacterized protein n=1 Tax=Pandoravirus japonicus TaxID=2823154 RepID=A0A811BN86_9VIRU|nr:hypothetical protein [Pandoravirus japonicus]
MVFFVQVALSFIRINDPGFFTGMGPLPSAGAAFFFLNTSVTLPLHRVRHQGTFFGEGRNTKDACEKEGNAAKNTDAVRGIVAAGTSG